LELATLAFAVLNIILYTLWWDKPLGVACPVPVHLCHRTTLDASLEPPPPPLFHHHPSAFAGFRTYFFKKFKEKGLFALVYISIFKPILIIENCVAEVGCDAIPDSPTQLSVPTFYAPDSSNNGFAGLIGFIVSVIFGGIHCIAWSLGFPSVPEEYVWRASAVATTTIPFILGLTGVFASAGSCPHEFFKFLVPLILYFSILVYCLSRAALLILPFLALRSLAPGSLLDFKWSSFIPHI